jgi:hypothetical protein
MYSTKRDKLAAALTGVGLTPVIPQGSYFILVDTAHLDVPLPTDDPRDVQICRWLTREIGVVAIPPSAFYSPGHKVLAKDVAPLLLLQNRRHSGRRVSAVAAEFGINGDWIKRGFGG